MDLARYLFSPSLPISFSLSGPRSLSRPFCIAPFFSTTLTPRHLTRAKVSSATAALPPPARPFRGSKNTALSPSTTSPPTVTLSIQKLHIFRLVQVNHPCYIQFLENCSLLLALFIPMNPLLMYHRSLGFYLEQCVTTYYSGKAMIQKYVDVSMMVGGDMAYIGEKGVNLSGGQRARLALARAMYHDSDVVMLDDVLSAVDVQVARCILHNAILGPLMQRKTRLLCTHNIQAISSADMIVVMDKGHIQWMGNSADIPISSYTKFFPLNEIDSALQNHRQSCSTNLSSKSKEQSLPNSDVVRALSFLKIFAYCSKNLSKL